MSITVPTAKARNRKLYKRTGTRECSRVPVYFFLILYSPIREVLAADAESAAHVALLSASRLE